MPNCRHFGLLLILSSGAACEREPLAVPCPEVNVGDLVISEIRGDQSGDDAWGQWIELYNRSGAGLEITGLAIELLRLDGGKFARIVVRETVTVGPDSFAVIGMPTEDGLVEHLDYIYSADLDSDLFVNAAVDVIACGVRTDRVIYRDLPSSGTYNFDGNLAPSADDNDVDANWCFDESPGTTADPGAPGSPGESNRPCP